MSQGTSPVLHAFRLGWRTLWRDLRAGELRLLIVAVTLAVAALTAVGFFADRLKGGLARDARQLLGGDVVVASDTPTPQAFMDQARALVTALLAAPLPAPEPSIRRALAGAVITADALLSAEQRDWLAVLRA